MRMRGGKGDQRRPLAGGTLRLSLPCKSSVVIPGNPSAHLTGGLKLNTGHWQTNDVCGLLRFSVLRETPMTFARGHFRKLKCSLEPCYDFGGVSNNPFEEFLYRRNVMHKPDPLPA